MSEEVLVNTTPSVFEQREICGLYDELANNLEAMGKVALGNVDCPQDFVRYQPPYSSNIEFRNKDGFEFRTMIVGEVADSLHGTVMRAIGNYYTGEIFQPIDDTKKGVKDILALVMPTCASVRLANFFDNQTVPLRAAMDHESEIESQSNPPQEYLPRGWMRSLEEKSCDDDIIMVHMPPKYGLPAEAGGNAVASRPVVSPRRAKRKLDEVVDRKQSKVASPSVTQNPSVSTSAISTGPVAKPSSSDIKLGALYDPRLLDDYGGLFFRHVKAGLVQLDVRDATVVKKNENDEDPLVPPWEFYDKLRPGTLVLVSASLHIFVMNDSESKGSTRQRKRKIYQINAHSIKILSHSDLPIEKKTILVPRGFEAASTSSAPPPPEFSNFRLKTLHAEVSGTAGADLVDEGEMVDPGAIPLGPDFEMLDAEHQKKKSRKRG